MNGSLVRHGMNLHMYCTYIHTYIPLYFTKEILQHLKIPDDEFAYGGFSAGPDDRGERSEEHSLEVEVSQLVLQQRERRREGGK